MSEKLMWDISKLRNWEKNPRGIKDKDFKRLKAQIKKLGQYKPLIVTVEGIVLGGNMRLRAYQQLGIKEVWVSVVEAKTETQMVEYALSDNDGVGYWEEDQLAELIQQQGQFDWSAFKVNLGKFTTIPDLLNKFAPSADGELDYEPKYQVVVECRNEIEQKETFEKLRDMGYKVTVLTL